MYLLLRHDTSVTFRTEYEEYSDQNIGTKKMYLPFRHYSFHDFHSPPLDDTDFDSLPLVLVIGCYHIPLVFSNMCLIVVIIIY